MGWDTRYGVDLWGRTLVARPVPVILYEFQGEQNLPYEPWEIARTTS